MVVEIRSGDYDEAEKERMKVQAHNAVVAWYFRAALRLLQREKQISLYACPRGIMNVGLSRL